jgi:hypothetical protein
MELVLHSQGMSEPTCERMTCRGFPGSKDPLPIQGKGIFNSQLQLITLPFISLFITLLLYSFFRRIRQYVSPP